MSITGGLDHKKPSHRRNDSGELDVFEAARYFSGYNDNYSLLATTNLTQKAVNKDEKRGYMREARVSLDVPSLKHYYLHQNKHSNETQQLQHHNNHHQHQLQQPSKSKEKKKYKQPSSPGGKIAQFLNSLFSQTNSKKKKPSKSFSSTTTTQSMKDDDESLVGRRKRRSSISHFRSSSSAVDARSMYSTSSSGFRTPPPYNLNAPSKSCKEFRSFDEYKDVLATLSKYNIQGNGNSKDENNNNNKSRASSNNNINWVDDHKLRVKNGLVEKPKNLNNGYQENKDINKFILHDDDDGAESDSSSDLFELQIDYDFGFCSSGLPVYETTHMDNIKRSSATAITSAPIKA